MQGCAAWSNWNADSLAFARWGHTLVYDAPRERLVAFGGLNDASATDNSVWTLNLNGTPVWTKLNPTGTPPSGRANATAIYDVTRQRAVIYGGSDMYGAIYGDAYALNLSTATPSWTHLTPAGTPPPARFSHTAIYDPIRDRMVIFGGLAADTGFAHAAHDVWALGLGAGGAWSQLTPSGTPPLNRYESAAIYDSIQSRMLVFGGLTAPDTTGIEPPDNQVWALSFTGTVAWTKLNPTGTPPPAMYSHTALRDPLGNRMVSFGGYWGTPGSGGDLNDVWALGLSGSTNWTKLAPLGIAPAPNAEHAAVYDAQRRRLVAFGGYTSGGDETWTLELGGTPTWAQVNAGGQVPRGREGHTLVIDAPGNRVVMFGGRTAGSYSVLSDVWTHPLSGPGAWTRMLPIGARLDRAYSTAVFDSVGRRLVVFGGYDHAFHVATDAWALSLAGTPVWSALTPSGTPPSARITGVGAYDALRRRLLLYGGSDSIGQYRYDTHALSLAGSGSWSALADSGGPQYFSAAAAYDAQRDRLVLVGMSLPLYLGQVSTLSLAAPGAWVTHPSPPTAPYPLFMYYGPSGAYDGARDRMLLYGGGLEGVHAVTLGGTPAWSQFGISGPDPGIRSWQGAAFDAPHSRLLAVGGQSGAVASGESNDFWALDLNSGSRSISARAEPLVAGSVGIAPAGAGCYPVGTVVHLRAYAAPGFSFTGWSGDASGSADSIDVTLNADANVVANFTQPAAACPGWQQLVASNGSLPLLDPSAVLDSLNHRVVAFGNSIFNSNTPQVWAMALDTLSDWVQLSTAGIPAPHLNGSVAAYDPAHQRAIIYGGQLGFSTFIDGDTWALTLGATPTWTHLVNAIDSPPARYGASLVYDGLRDRMVLFGGSYDPVSYAGAPTYRNETYVLPMGGPPAWTLLTPSSGPLPQARFEHSAAYDPLQDRMIVYGGCLPGNAFDAWSLSFGSGATWSPLTIYGPSDFHAGQASMTIDPVRNRLVIFGGRTLYLSGTATAETRVVSLDGEMRLHSLHTVGPTPPPLSEPASVYDLVSDRMIVLGGFDQPNFAHDGTYALSFRGAAEFETYVPNAAGGTISRSPGDSCYAPGTTVTLTAVPAPNYVFTGWLGDAIGNTNPLEITLGPHTKIGAEFISIVTATTFAHFDAERVGGDVRLVWSMGEASDATLIVVERAERESGPWTALDRAAVAGDEGFVVVDPQVPSDRDWYYRLAATQPDGSLRRSGVAAVRSSNRIERTELARVGPNPGSRVAIEFTLAHAGPVRLSVIDVSGREVAVLVNEARAVGRYSEAVGSASASRRMAPGVYFLRLQVDHKFDTRRIVLMP